MPQRTTIVGDDITYDFVNCNDTFCSEKIIDFDAPLAQLGLLVDKSPSCGQTITFMCQSAPIMVNYMPLAQKMYSLKYLIDEQPCLLFLSFPAYTFSCTNQTIL